MSSAEARTRPEREAMERSPEEQREHERRAVAEHYQHDVDIFSMVLDSRLAYATGVFHRPDEDLETAQRRKFARIQAKLAIQPGERVLDVGCGWGSNLLYLAEHTGGHFFGITLSERQRDEALRRARASGVEDRVRIEVRHVEDLALEPASFDAILFSGSIVHMHNREAVHGMVGRLLKPSGRLLISDCYYPAESRGDRESSATQYIFVEALGYCRLLHLGEELSLIEKAGLDILHVEDLTSSYVLTLERWIDNVRKNRRRIDELSPGFSRVLQQYMTVAKLSFARRTALEYMILATKGRPAVDVAAFPILPPGYEEGSR
ncbi:SAM-dependent methyltransferase [Polyangium aurulentum]|uniref:SAM-dependent methyltransferase n=1 Tax=Polyangium aurulentum TaxID=2567896 RepID=UPI0010AEE9EC|nr:class I SAM-dependent methyltransferase [Polyangium aurulentum]UQA58979.1 class I SAM-dependent methyltransferase [Polyangium aurulentum]